MQENSKIPSGTRSDAGSPTWANPSVTSAPPISFMTALIVNNNASRPEMTRPIHISLVCITVGLLVR